MCHSICVGEGGLGAHFGAMPASQETYLSRFSSLLRVDTESCELAV
jgi:hypothetical protein